MTQCNYLSKFDHNHLSKPRYVFSSQNADTFFELGMCEWYKANLVEAEQAFNNVLKLDSDFAMARFWLGQCFKRQFKDEQLVALYSKLLEEFPAWSAVAFDLALAYEGIGKVTEATTCFEKLIDVNRTNSVAFYHLGNLYLKTGQIQKAIQTYQEGLAISPASDLLEKPWTTSSAWTCPND